MRFAIILAIMSLSFSLKSEILEGVYASELVTCGNYSAEVTLEVVEESSKYYKAYLRIDKASEPKGQLWEYEYTGIEDNGSIMFYFQNHYSIDRKGIQRSNSTPGIRLRPEGFVNNPFVLGTFLLRVNDGRLEVDTSPSLGRRCSFPTLRYDTSLTEFYRQSRTYLESGIYEPACNFFSCDSGNDKVFLIRNWSESLLRYYPQLNGGFFYKNNLQREYFQLRDKFFLIFRDDIFVPIFGKPFDQISDLEKQEVLMELVEINSNSSSKRVYNRQKGKIYSYLLSWQPQLLEMSLKECGYLDQKNESFCSENIIYEIGIQRWIKQELDNHLQQLASNEIASYGDYDKFRDLLSQNVGRLFPNEIDFYASEIERLENARATEILQLYISEIESMTPSILVLKKSQTMRETESYKRLSPANTESLSDLLDSLVSKTESLIVEQELFLLNSLIEERKGIHVLNTWHQNYEQQFNDIKYPINNTLSQPTLTFHFAKKAIVMDNEDLIISEINSAETVEELREIDQKYLNPFWKGEEVYHRIGNALEARRNYLYYRDRNKESLRDYTLEEIIEINQEEANNGEPNEEQMRLATIIRLTGKHDWFFVRNEAGILVREPNNQLERFFMSYSQELRYIIEDFKKISCSSPDDNGYYKCRCELVGRAVGEIPDRYRELFMIFNGNREVFAGTCIFYYDDNHGWQNLGEDSN